MKRIFLGAACISTAMAVSGAASAASDTGMNGYDRLALDQYIGQSLAEQNAKSASVPSAIDMMQGQTPMIAAVETTRFDSEGYLVGPDGKRVEQPLRPRWRVGVFR